MDYGTAVAFGLIILGILGSALSWMVLAVLALTNETIREGILNILRFLT